MIARLFIGLLGLIVIYGIIGTFDSVFLSFKEFLFNSIWGVIAIVLGVFSILFFYASAKTSKNSKSENSLIPSGNSLSESQKYLSGKKSSYASDSNSYSSYLKNKSGSGGSMSSNLVVQNREIDVSVCQMDAFSNKLANLMTKPEPVFFKGWRNRRLKLDIEHMYLIKDYVDAMRDAGESFVRFKVDQIFSYEKIQGLVQLNRNDLLRQLRESELQIDLLENEHRGKIAKLNLYIRELEVNIFEKLTQVKELQANIAKIHSDIENTRNDAISRIKITEQESIANIQAREKELEIKEQESIANIEARAKELEIKEQEALANIEINKAKTDAEIFVMKIKATDKSKIAQQRSAVLDKIIKEMNLNNIRPLEVYLLIKLLDTINTDDFMDFDKKVQLMDEELNRMKAENRYKTAEAVEKEAEAKERAAQSKANIKDINNPYA
jgi:hypothetical protein